MVSPYLIKKANEENEENDGSKNNDRQALSN
jgi:hypothetical protein